MIFFSPIWFLLLLPLVAALFLWRLPTRGLNIVRLVILLLLVFAMAQPAIKLKDQQGTVVVLIDRSESMPHQATDDQLEILKSIHGEMGPEDRLVINLLDLERKSVAEITEITGWKASAVKVRAFRARKKLKKHLEELEKGISHG